MFDDQNYYKLLNTRSEQRYQREIEQLRWIAAEMKAHKGPKESRMRYARSVAQFLLICTEMEAKWNDEYFRSASKEQLAQDQMALYSEIEPSHYPKSVWNPAFAVKVMGAESGALLSAVCGMMQRNVDYAYRHMRFAMHSNHELFLDLFQLLNLDRKIHRDEIEELISNHLTQKAREMMSIHTHLIYDFQNAALRERVETMDLSDPLNLYSLGQPVSQEALERYDLVQALSEDEVHDMADHLVQAYRRGFFQGGRDILAKKVVSIRYPLGMERIAAEAFRLFREEIHYVPHLKAIDHEPVNPQFIADHRDDRDVLASGEFYEIALQGLDKELQDNHDMMDIHGGEAVFSWPALEEILSEKTEPCEEALVPNEEQRAMASTFQEEAQALFEKHMPYNSMSYANYPVCLNNDPTKEE